MKKWDILEITVSTVNVIDIICTNPEEIKILCEHILREGLNHFVLC